MIGPDTMYGFPVLAAWPFKKQPMTRAGRVILLDRGPESRQRYVVARHFREGATGLWDGEWDNGSYSDSAEDAIDVWKGLVLRYCEVEP